MTPRNRLFAGTLVGRVCLRPPRLFGDGCAIMRSEEELQSIGF